MSYMRQWDDVGSCTVRGRFDVVDMDECATDDGGCTHSCENTPGSFLCGCPAGHQLGTDLRSCYSKCHQLGTDLRSCYSKCHQLDTDLRSCYSKCQTRPSML